MTRFRVVVVDDEPLARRMLVRLLHDDADIESVLECESAASASRTIARMQPDIVFLDIQMPEVSGLELARELAEDGPILVFVTAFAQYAPEAFTVSASDYLVKPFSDRRFSDALERAKGRVRERRLGRLAEQVASVSSEFRGGAPASAGSNEILTRLIVKSGDRTLTIRVSEILWIEAEDYYARVHTTHGRYLQRLALSSLETRLDPRQFVRVHRAAIVNLDEVREIRAGVTLELVLSDGTVVGASRTRRNPVEAAIAVHRAQASASRQTV